MFLIITHIGDSPTSVRKTICYLLLMVVVGHSGDWQSSSGCAASELRLVKTHLQQNGRFLVAGAQKTVARVRHPDEGAIHQTWRYGLRLDVALGPYGASDEWQRSIHDAKAIWVHRTGAFSNELPLVRWYKMVDVAYPWQEDEPPLDGPIPEGTVSGENEGGADAPTGVPPLMPSWPNFLLAGLSSTSAIADGVFAMIGRHKRHWVLPAFVGLGTAYGVWTYSDEDGPLRVLVDKGGVAANRAFEALVWIRDALYWCMVDIVLIFIFYVLYRIIRLMDWGIRWIEPWSGSSENGSDDAHSSPERQPVARESTTSRLPSEMPDASTAETVSPMSRTFESTDDEGEGVFSSRDRRALGVVLETDATDPCLARQVFPSDGNLTAVSGGRFYEAIATAVFLLGDETSLSDGHPTGTPASGGSITMCELHAAIYDARSRGTRCHVKDCFRRGFAWEQSAVQLITGSHHLGGLSVSQDKSVEWNIDDGVVQMLPKEDVPPNPSDVKRKGTASRGKPVVRRDGGNVKTTAEVASPSSTSESWQSREEEIQSLFGLKSARLSEEPEPRGRGRHQRDFPAYDDELEAT